MHARLGVRVLQIVDELLDVLDRVDVVVRGRRDELHARRREAHLGDPRIDLGPGSWPPSPGLAPWAILIWRSVGVDQVLAGDAEAAGRDLLDGAPPPVAVGVRAGSAPRPRRPRRCSSAPPIRFMRDRQGLVRLLADRAVGHRAGGEALQDRLDRLDLVDRHRASRRAERDEAAQASPAACSGRRRDA